ncbi:MAG: succinate dehydrogenase membrane anchor subunit [Phycisphaerae bacterium]|nr:MAG: succinate dehydrogenase membrane anchor subunit [Phycisphaerae bacterium]
MSRVELKLPQLRPLGATQRTDAWWIQPVLTLLGLGAFIVYSTWAALQGTHYWVPGTNYLSPMYSPVLFDSWQIAPASSGHAWFGAWPDWIPKNLWVLSMTPAFLILWAPGGFRFTCYYYRGAYYKAFWADPVSCAVGEPKFRGTHYRGEHKFPLLLQNIHRYFLYLALVFLVFLTYDAIISYRFLGDDGQKHFGVGIGSLVLTINPILLGGYTLGCHSLRHLIGGKKDCITDCSGARQGAYRGVSCLNRRHMLFAWLSLFWVGFTDVYVRLVSMGTWTDIRIL